MAVEYSIDKISYVEILSGNKKTIVCDDGEKYVDIDNNAPDGFHKKKCYDKRKTKLINNFSDMLKFNNLWVMLIDPLGKVKTKLTKLSVSDLLNAYLRMSVLNELVVREVDYISTLVNEKCIENILSIIEDKKISISLEQELNLRKLLKSYIYIDLVVNGLNGNKMIIRKEDKLIDYRILRLLKYLGLNFNFEEIPNFKIEYNLEKINYYDSKGNKITDYNLDQEEMKKIKKLVDKRAN